jgi:hypothetical protein
MWRTLAQELEPDWEGAATVDSEPSFVEGYARFRAMEGGDDEVEVERARKEVRGGLRVKDRLVYFTAPRDWFGFPDITTVSIESL